MSNIVRAWKDESYREGLSVEEQALLPTNPVGEIELTEAELEAISGAFSSFPGYNSGNINSQENQIITFEPVGGSSVTISGGRCNNVGSPSTSSAFHLF